MIPVENIGDWRGQDVVDPNGEKLGKLEEVYYDGETDEPAFAAVKTGLVSKSLTLVPLARACVGRDYVRVDRRKAEFKKAPSFDTDAELSLDDEAATYEHYALDVHARGRGRPPPREALAADRDEPRSRSRAARRRRSADLLLVAQRRVDLPAVQVGARHGLAESNHGASSSRMCASGCRCSRMCATWSPGCLSTPACVSHQAAARSSRRSTSNSSTTSRAPWRRTSDSRRSESPSGTTWCSETIATAASNERGGASRSSSATGSDAGGSPCGVDRGDVVAGGAQRRRPARRRRRRPRARERAAAEARRGRRRRRQEPAPGSTMPCS